MKWLNPSVYLIGALLTLGPVGLRMATRSDPPHQLLEQSAISAGKMLFTHEFTPNDPLCPNGDGLGPVFNAKSCVACHFQGGVGGSGGNDRNVTNFVSREKNRGQGVVHADATKPEFRETLQHVNQGLPAFPLPNLNAFIQKFGKGDQLTSVVSLSQRNTPALFGAKLIDELPDRVIIAGEKFQRLSHALESPASETVPVGRALRLRNGQVGKFGWKAQSASLSDFVQAACANELGLGNPGQEQPSPLAQPGYRARGIDLTTEQCRQITTFIAALDRPKEFTPAARETREFAHQGKQLFTKIGCADCHTPTMGSVEGIYSDLLLHRMGSDLVGVGSYNGPVPPPDSPSEDSPRPDEWRTPPLWGVANSGPYMHDGRATTLAQAIAMHGGQGRNAADGFQRLSETQKGQVIEFLNNLRAPQ